jgi:hypothetical protein
VLHRRAAGLLFANTAPAFLDLGPQRAAASVCVLVVLYIPVALCGCAASWRCELAEARRRLLPAACGQGGCCAALGPRAVLFRKKFSRTAFLQRHTTATRTKIRAR